MCKQPKVDDCTTASKNKFIKYYYDGKLKQCQVFTWCGPGNNGNNFQTRQECDKTCKNTPAGM